jgi:hypothetical protein
MNDGLPKDIPEDVEERVRSEPATFLGRDKKMERKYKFADGYESEPMKAIQKEKDGMARLLCALASEEEVDVSNSKLIEVYRREMSGLLELEEGVIDELPKQSRYK